jgi:WXXGXW repeat (2 copies)
MGRNGTKAWRVLIGQNNWDERKATNMKRSLRGLFLGILMATISVAALSTTSSAQIGISISVRIGPPALPIYAQPICPGAGYLWTPGYWGWNDDGGYYWIPGTWVIAPVGRLWTPGYWGFAGGLYGWHAGYWGPHVGFYGGINYGFGYGGVGFGGGEWRGGSFFYNRSVTNVNVRNVTNVYNRTVIVNNTRTSFNGPGGIPTRPTPQEEAFGREQHTAALSSQVEHERAASQNREMFASNNHGRPAIAATARPGEFKGSDVQRASAAGERYNAPKMSPREARASSEGNRDESNRNESVRNDSSRNARNDRDMDRSDNRQAKNPARDNQARNNNEENRQNRDRMSSRDNQSHNQKPSKQEKQAQKQSQKQQQKQAKAQQKQAKAEQKRGGGGGHR